MVKLKKFLSAMPTIVFSLHHAGFRFWRMRFIFAVDHSKRVPVIPYLYVEKSGLRTRVLTGSMCFVDSGTDSDK
jgi:hypothetical protein